MNYYVIILMTIFVLRAGIALGQSKSDDMGNTVIGFCMLLPLFGRILGWW